VEEGVLTWPGVTAAAWPFLVALLQARFPDKPVIVVVDDLKRQEAFHQDLRPGTGSASSRSPGGKDRQTSFEPRPCSFPWKSPHEAKLPHADVISERLECLVALTAAGALAPLTRRGHQRHRAPPAHIHTAGAAAPPAAA
jgi:hypothetical protein